MSKKLLIGICPLVTVVAIAMTPVAAQAVACKPWTPGAIGHFCKNGTKLTEFPNVTAEKTPFIDWASLSLTSPEGVVKCKNVTAGNDWNPEGGGFGQDETVVFATYECTGPCPFETRVTAKKLPWKSELFEGAEENGTKVLKDRSTGVEVAIGCFLGGSEVVAPSDFEGSSEPTAKSGNSGCNKPGELVFGKGISGLLLNPATGAEGYTTGVDKICGFTGQELINSET
jgi:hypothetical protein